MVPRASPVQRALLHSQGGPLSGPFTTLPSHHSSGWSLTCSGFSCCVASTFLSHCPLASASVAVLSTALAITVPVVQGQGFWGGGFALESPVARISREDGVGVSANVFLRDLWLQVRQAVVSRKKRRPH